jgi:hypothetical protein
MEMNTGPKHWLPVINKKLIVSNISTSAAYSPRERLARDDTNFLMPLLGQIWFKFFPRGSNKIGSGVGGGGILVLMFSTVFHFVQG